MIILLSNQELKNFTIINMEHKITLSYSEQQEMELFCRLNSITFEELIKKAFKIGYNIEKYGLARKMGGDEEKWVEKEVVREKRVEIPVEVIKEVIKVEYIEVPVEKIVTIYDKNCYNELSLKVEELELEKQLFSTKLQECDDRVKTFSTKTTETENIFHNNDNSQQLQNTIQTLMKNLRDKNIEIDELKKQLVEQQKNNEMNERAKYLRSSNLDDNLYK